MTWKQTAKKLLPPLALDLARALRPAPPPAPPEWEYVPDGWKSRDPNIKGWNVESVLQQQKARWPAFVKSVQSARPMSVSHEAATPSDHDYAVHNTLMCYGYALALAARKKDRLSILDWGGGIGHYYVFTRALLPGVELDYHVKEVPLLCQGGRELLPEATFHESEDCLERGYDFVLASGSMHYAEDWRGMVRKLAAAARGFFYITRLPVVMEADPFVVVQRPAVHGYDTEYLGWFLNRAQLAAEAEGAGMKLVREFLIQERPAVHNAPEQGEYRGFLFRQAEKLPTP